MGGASATSILEKPMGSGGACCGGGRKCAGGVRYLESRIRKVSGLERELAHPQ